MIRRILMLSVLTIAAGAVAFASPAGAQNYGGCNATVTDDTPAAGQTVTVSGSGGHPNGAVSAAVAGTTVGSGTADASGNFSFPATIPASATGTITLDISCGAGAGVDAITLTISAGGQPLPVTGSSDTIPLTTIAIVMLTLGGIVLVIARRRTKSHSA
jgi:LPXTG-motif cell wall-anchored protein